MMPTLIIALSFFVSAPAVAAPASDTPGNRLEAANHLFEPPAYRQIATRRLYESLKSLAAERHGRAPAALSDPAVMTSLRGVISRSMAQTFSTAALKHPARFLRADEACSMFDNTQSFQSIPMKALLTASVSDPEPIRMLIEKK